MKKILITTIIMCFVIVQLATNKTFANNTKDSQDTKEVLRSLFFLTVSTQAEMVNTKNFVMYTAKNLLYEANGGILGSISKKRVAWEVRNDKTLIKANLNNYNLIPIRIIINHSCGGIGY